MEKDWCQYCHDMASMFCLNNKCNGNRKHVCKKCAESQKCRCRDCGERFVDIAELENGQNNTLMHLP